MPNFLPTSAALFYPLSFSCDSHLKDLKIIMSEKNLGQSYEPLSVLLDGQVLPLLQTALTPSTPDCTKLIVSPWECVGFVWKWSWDGHAQFSGGPSPLVYHSTLIFLCLSHFSDVQFPQKTVLKHLEASEMSALSYQNLSSKKYKFLAELTMRREDFPWSHKPLPGPLLCQ